MSVLNGPGEGTWSVFALKIVEECDELRYKLAGRDAHIKSLEGLLVDAVRERDEVAKERDRARLACNAYWHDLERIASLCERTADEYPLKAVERTVRERDELKAKLDAELPAMWREDIASLNECLDRVGRDSDELKARLAHVEADAEQAIHNEALMERQRIVDWIRARHALGSMDCSLSLMALDALRVVADEIDHGEHER